VVSGPELLDLHEVVDLEVASGSSSSVASAIKKGSSWMVRRPNEVRSEASFTIAQRRVILIVEQMLNIYTRDADALGHELNLLSRSYRIVVRSFGCIERSSLGEERDGPRFSDLLIGFGIFEVLFLLASSEDKLERGARDLERLRGGDVAHLAPYLELLVECCL